MGCGKCLKELPGSVSLVARVVGIARGVAAGADAVVDLGEEVGRVDDVPHNQDDQRGAGQPEGEPP